MGHPIDMFFKNHDLRNANQVFAYRVIAYQVFEYRVIAYQVIAYRVLQYRVIVISGFVQDCSDFCHIGFLFMMARVFVYRVFDRRVIEIGF
jgi:hypothetical protein